MPSDAPKYAQAELGAYRKALLRLLSEGPIDTSKGVCYNLSTMLEDPVRYCGYDFVAAEAYDWQHALYYSDGKLCDYFVPHTYGGLWVGENLKMRQNLIQYLLGRVAHHEAMLRGGVALAG
jgi:hypothetical protein